MVGHRVTSEIFEKKNRTLSMVEFSTKEAGYASVGDGKL
jgi:hypothetical protein